MSDEAKPGDTSQLSELITAMLDGAITQEQFDQLDELLAGDEGTLEYYAEFLTLCAVLRKYYGAELPASDRGPRGFDQTVVLSEVIEQDLQTQAEIEADVAGMERQARREVVRRAAEEALERFMAEERRRQEELAHKLYLARRRRLLVGMGSLAALLVVVLCVWLFEPRPEPPAAVTPTMAAAPPVVARVTDSLDAQWRPRGMSTEPGTELIAGPLSLRRGLVRITFNCGADVILEAPAEIEIEAVDQMLLWRGRVAAKAGKEAIGFTVRTPGATVVDYGTEFGVSVSGSGQTEAHVFKGQVEVRSGPSVRVFDESRRVTAQQACAVDREGKLSQTNLAARPELFQRHVPSPYELAVWDTRPAAYWRFDADDPNQFVNVLDQRTNLGHLVGPVQFSMGPDLGADKQAQALELDGYSGRAVVANMTPPSGTQTTGYTYVMWVRPDEIRDQFILAAVNKAGAQRVVAMTADGRFDHYYVSGKGKPVARVQSQTIARRGLWYHVAILRTGHGDRRLFVNGVLDASAEASVHGTPGFLRKFCLGAMDEEKHMAGLAPWRGGLSEMAIYCRALSEREIADLYMSSQER